MHDHDELSIYDHASLLCASPSSVKLVSVVYGFLLLILLLYSGIGLLGTSFRFNLVILIHPSTRQLLVVSW